MKKQDPIEIFMPPNILKAKVGGSLVGLDTAAVKRAEQVLSTLKTEFATWLAADVQRLAECRAAFAADQSSEHRDALYRASHDLRGQAATFEFPLVERVASSLCRLLDETSAVEAIGLIDAHVNAIHIIVRDNIKDRSDAIATTLVKELESRVSELAAALKARKSTQAA